MTDAFSSRLDDAKGGFPPAAKFEKKGDRLEGVVLDYAKVDGEYGEQIVVRVLCDDEEERALYLSQLVLKNQFARLNPRAGERIGVKYLGSKMGQNGRNYKDFAVLVDRPASAGGSFADFTGQNPPASGSEPEENGAQNGSEGSDPAEKPPVSEPDDDLPF